MGAFDDDGMSLKRDHLLSGVVLEAYEFAEVDRLETPDDDVICLIVLGKEFKRGKKRE